MHILIFVLMLSLFSFAELEVSSSNYKQNVPFRVPDSTVVEHCIIPKHIPGVNYLETDHNTEIHLCDFDLYSSYYGVCPKLHSTNPGIEFHKLSDSTKVDFENEMCKKSSRKGRRKEPKVAKIKFSTSCSYTPSIVGYYHISRLFGGAGLVPAAIFRTIDKEYFLATAEKALDTLEGREEEIIHQTWYYLHRKIKYPKEKTKLNLLVDDEKQVYGALSNNIRGEEWYAELNGASRVDDRVASFQRTYTFNNATRSSKVTKYVSTEFTTRNLQKILAMKDITDLLLIDYLLSQNDRFGNIHYLYYYYYWDTLGNKKTLHSERAKKKNAEQMEELQAVKVKRMLLKDNDCGVSKSNIVKIRKILEKITHLDPETFYSLKRLEKIVDNPYIKGFFMEQLLFTEEDYTRFAENVHSAYSILHTKCLKGRLHLDLNVENHFLKKPVPTCK
jgi:hypothetical protein